MAKLYAPLVGRLPPPLEEDPRVQAAFANIDNMRKWAECAVDLQNELNGLRSKRAGDAHNGVIGAVQGWEGGRPREWSDNERYQRLMEEDAKRLIEEGCSDHEVADAVFGDDSRMYRKRIERYRKRLSSCP